MFDCLDSQDKILLFQWIDPLFDAGGPVGGTRKMHTMTRDSVLAFFLIKLRRNTPYSQMAVMFGCKERKLCQLFNEILMFVFSIQAGPTGDPTWLHRGRNLGQIAHLISFYDEIHHFTMLQERAAGTLEPSTPIDSLLCVLNWDSRAILVDKNQNYLTQRRTWSTKHHGNSCNLMVNH